MVRRAGPPSSVERFSLRNGLSVVLSPELGSPTASVWVWYRVGSKNEAPGITGASHWVEHMLFQGSPRFRKGEMDRAVVEVGGELNAFTDTDFTAYFTTVPREHVGVPLDIESDRMTRALFEPREVERERTVIRSEREGNENWPEFRAEEELYHLAFRTHPYRWDPLGLPGDILSLTPRDLHDYYRRYYGTRNAVLVIAGGFPAGAMRREVVRRFSRLPSSGADPHVPTREPPPNAERRAELAGPGTTPYLECGWRAPAFDESTTPATILLDVVLGGENRLFAVGSTWGRAREHPSARLYRRLVDPGLAVRAVSEFRPKVHPGLFTIHVQSAPGIKPERIEEALDAEIDGMVRSGPTASELAEAKAKLARAATLSYEGATRTGFRLGYFAMFGPPGLERDLLRRVLRTSRKAVHDVARSILRPVARATVWYLPTEEDRGR
ncbi:MAG TPA: pitrilysin family protein [Thermoplasmata archaeon]|nr:pitrilysin family protein [Thermoplasmata archaeon]